MNFLQSIIFGFLSGLTDIFPVSSQAHKTLYLTFMGVGEEPAGLRLMIHLATLTALYYSHSTYLQKMIRQRRLAKIPKRRRKRPVDLQSLMDSRLLITAGIPILLCYLLYSKVQLPANNLSWISAFLLLNGIILFVPVILPSGNKDSRALTPIEGVLMGLSAIVSFFPGMSSIAAMTTIACAFGVDRTFALNIALILHMVVTAALIVYDLLAIFTVGFGIAGFGAFLAVLIAGAAAFISVLLAIHWMRMLAANVGFSAFSLYCFGLAVLTFILYLTI